MITVNGESVEKNFATLGGYLRSENYNTARIAVELNGEIAPKAKYDETPLNDGDKLEIVNFVGGG